MNDLRKSLLLIGSFSKAAQLSVKALRLYDQLGILTPVLVDRESGYRYYSPDQLHIARVVRLMRQMEMPLALIRQVLSAASQDTAHAEQLVLDHVHRREKQMEQVRKLIPGLVKVLRKEKDAMALTVQVKDIPAQPVVSLTRHVKIEDLLRYIQSSVEELSSWIAARGSAPVSAPFGLYHGPVNPNDDGPMEVCVPVPAEFAVDGDFESKTLPGGRAASVVMEGEQCDFPEILKGYDAVYDWIQANGYQEVGPPREVWHTPPGQDERVEVIWLFEEKG